MGLTANKRKRTKIPLIAIYYGVNDFGLDLAILMITLLNGTYIGVN